MKRLLDNLADLLKVKTLITLAIVGSLCWAFVTGNVTTEVFAAIAGSVVTYYFTKTKEAATDEHNSEAYPEEDK